MKICPKCMSARLTYSHTHSFFETMLKFLTDSRYYRCRDCDWRGRRLSSSRKTGYFSPKKNLQAVIALSILIVLAVLYVTFVMVGTGG